MSSYNRASSFIAPRASAWTEQSASGLQPSLLVSLWTSSLLLFLPFILVYIIGMAALFPAVPTILANGFASEAAGHPVSCQDFTPDSSPEECRIAHVQVVTWGSWTSFISGSILSVLLSPVIGSLSDKWGRKPFMILGVILGLTPMVVLMLHLWGWVSVYWYYPASLLNSLVSSFSMTITAVADLMRPQHRAAAAAFVLAMFSIGLIVGPLISGWLNSNVSTVYFCIEMTLAALFYLLLVVPESAPRLASRSNSRVTPEIVPAAERLLSAETEELNEGDQQLPPVIQESRNGMPGGGFLAGSIRGLRVVMSSSWYLKLAIIWALVSAMSSGAQETLMQYLELRLGFNSHDQSELLVVMASVSLSVKVFLLGLLIFWLGDRGVMALGLAAYVAQYLMLARATSKDQVLVAVSVGALAAICWPAMIALQSSRADPKEWGAISGALQSIGSLAGGVGPLLFAATFASFSHKEGEGQGGLPYMPEMVWYLAAMCGFMATIVTLSLETSKAGLGEEIKEQP